MALFGLLGSSESVGRSERRAADASFNNFGRFSSRLNALESEGFFDPEARRRLGVRATADREEAARIGEGARRSLGSTLGRGLSSIRADLLETPGGFGSFGSRRGAEVARRNLVGDVAERVAGAESVAAGQAADVSKFNAQAQNALVTSALSDRFRAEMVRLQSLMSLFQGGFQARRDVTNRPGLIGDMLSKAGPQILAMANPVG